MQRVYGFFHYLSSVVYGMFFRGEVAGLENLPQSGSFLIAANHASFLDPPFIGSQVPRQIAYFARKTLWKPGIASWWLDEVGTIPVDRDGGQDVSAIKRVLKALKDNRGLILFPEGTRTSDGRLQEPKAGVGLIACRAQVPVVPARIFGSYAAFGKGRSLRLGTPVSVVFGRPILPGTYDDPAAGKERYQLASTRIFAHIAALVEPVRPVI
ncbi:MAG: 1-acyl-sn-glycerol-3-phosphate acyltransferase [Opitutaceae bacterium]|nr:1-acyl-sn-glycerol-3-phosphate acyltransferase [Opitutaceae bacterium]MBP9913350.1 1-acyl-sn-glycerol-3-phosphate acyltransferase [Opitutaceae bacterium]